MHYRTRTYLAGDWEGDNNLIQTILYWKNNGYLALDFTDAHDLQQARDDSLNCTIKNSLSDRLNASKSFVLVVGEKTNIVTSGGCQYCREYRNNCLSCLRNHRQDLRSYIEYECEKAARDYHDNVMKVVVIYNYMRIYREKCPEAVRHIGTHLAGITYDERGNLKFDYQAIKNAIMY